MIASPRGDSQVININYGGKVGVYYLKGLFTQNLTLPAAKPYENNDGVIHHFVNESFRELMKN